MSYEKLEQLYEGKAKKVFATSDPNVVIVSYKDDATAFNGLKKGTITGKGAINNRMTNNLMRRLEEKGVPTHYVEGAQRPGDRREKGVHRPLEVIIRNISAGSFAKRFGVEEGIVFDAPTIEFSYKNDDLGDPLMNSYHALALKLATQEEIDLIKKYAFAVNDLLRGFMKEIGIDLVDFKLEFGKTADGTIVLADEISPDTCRLWDEQTHEKLDKDRFRRDLGGAEGGLRGGHAPPDGDQVIHGRFLRRDYQAGLRAGCVLRYRLPLPPGHQPGGMAVYDRKDGFQRQIHNIENTPFRTKFEQDLAEFHGCCGIGCISDTDPQPLLVRSHLGLYAITTVGIINNADALVERYFSDHGHQFMAMSSGKVNATELVPPSSTRRTT